MNRIQLRHKDYKIGVICALRDEFTATRRTLDEVHEDLPQKQNDTTAYALGRIDKHNIVIACLPAGITGMVSAAGVARDMTAAFPNIRFGLMVGVGGGVPSLAADIRLGDIIVSHPGKGHGGVLNYRFGKSIPGGFERTGFLNTPPLFLLSAVNKLASNIDMNQSNLSAYLLKISELPKFSRSSTGPDILFEAESEHVDGVGCESCKGGITPRKERPDQIPRVFYGSIASADEVMRDGKTRDDISHKLGGVACFEMEAAGLMNKFPCLVIRGVCDYADSHKNKDWQPYAAAAAAAYAKDLLMVIPPEEVAESRLIDEATRTSPWQAPAQLLSTVPFRRDPDFIDRGNLLSQVDEICSQPAGRAALVGLGGAGKSQLAIEYAWLTGDRSPNTRVFWVYAGNAARFEQGYLDIAEGVKIPGRENPKANIFKLVYNWLRDNEEGWLIILDNVDDARFLIDGQPVTQSQPGNSTQRVIRPLIEYLPQSRNGSILITTRSRESALKLVEQRDIIMVNPMDEADALRLLEKKLDSTAQSSHESYAELVAELEFMPYPIVQAAAYISRLGPRYSVRQYINDFRKNDHKGSTLLSYEAGHLRRDREAKNSIITTWQVSFNYIREKRPSAAELLSLMSFYDSQGIPEVLVRSSSDAVEDRLPGDREGGDCDRDKDRDKDRDSEISKDDGFEEDVVALRSFSFISDTADPTTFQMHKLVQLATRNWLERSGQFKRCQQRYIKNLYTVLPNTEFESWSQYHTLFPHMQSAIAHRPSEKESLQEYASIMHNGAWYAWQRGNVAAAAEMSTKATKTREDILGQEDKATLSSLDMMGLIYDMAGRWSEAEELFFRVLEKRKMVLGVDNSDTLTSMSYLASIYKSQGRWKEAEQLFAVAMETRTTISGMDHPDTLTSMVNLASIYRILGRWKEAEKLDMEAMKRRTTILGANHPDTLTSVADLASTLWNQGRWKEAEELEMQVMIKRKTILGANHPDTLSAMANLASTYKDQDRSDEAEQLLLQVTEIRKAVLGADHPATLASMAILASTYRKQGRVKKAEELQTEQLNICKRVLPANHPAILSCIASLALIFWDQGRWEEAEELEEQVMEARKKGLGVEHPDTLISFYNFAFTLRNKGEYRKAMALMEECAERRREVLSLDHPSTKRAEDTLNLWRMEGMHINTSDEEGITIAAS